MKKKHNHLFFTLTIIFFYTLIIIIYIANILDTNSANSIILNNSSITNNSESNYSSESQIIDGSNSINNSFDTMTIKEKVDLFYQILDYKDFIEGTIVNKQYDILKNTITYDLDIGDSVQTIVITPFSPQGYDPEFYYCGFMDYSLLFDKELVTGIDCRIYYDKEIYDITGSFLVKAVIPKSNKDELQKEVTAVINMFEQLEKPVVITPDDALIEICNNLSGEKRRVYVENNPIAPYYESDGTVVAITGLGIFEDNYTSKLVYYFKVYQKTDDEPILKNLVQRLNGYVELKTGKVVF